MRVPAVLLLRRGLFACSDMPTIDSLRGGIGRWAAPSPGKQQTCNNSQLAGLVCYQTANLPRHHGNEYASSRTRDKATSTATR